MRALAAGPIAVALGLAAAGCGDTLVDHRAPADLVGGGLCDPAACPAPAPGLTGARAACLGAPGAQLCGYECTGGLLKCSDGCCPAAAIAAGGAHTCATTGSPGDLYCWGANESGQVNTVASGPVVTPQKVVAGGVSAIALGASHTCAIVLDSVTCWGANAAGQAPSVVSLGSPTALAAGAEHTCAIDGGAVRCWGGGAPGISTPIASGATAISAGASHTCALVGDVVRCWGAGLQGQLGVDPAPPSAASPVDVVLLGSGGAAALAAGSDLSCAAANSPTGGQLDDALQCWGTGLGALLPASPQLTPAVPRKDAQTSLIRFDVETLSAGRAHVCVKRAGASFVQCLGPDNAWGQLGGPLLVPPEANDVPGTLGARAFAAGADHTCAVLDTGGVHCWGRNSSGQLGDGTQVTPFVDDGGARRIGTPVPVSGR